MTTTQKEARDIIFAQAYAEWKLAVVEHFGGIVANHPVLFQGKVENVPAADKVWARFSMNGVDEAQSNLGVVNEKRRRTAIGVVFVQMFFPISATGAWDKGLLLGARVKNALARPSSSGKVWLRNARVNELTPDATHHRLNVVAEYEYDELV